MFLHPFYLNYAIILFFISLLFYFILLLSLKYKQFLLPEHVFIISLMCIKNTNWA